MSQRPLSFRAAALCLCAAASQAHALDANGPAWLSPECLTFSGSYGDHVGSDRALAYDHHGNPGIAFFEDVGDNLCYARRVPGVGWTYSLVDSTGYMGKYPALAYDRYERPAISYQDSSLGYLRFAYFNGSSWVVQTVDGAASVGAYSSLAFDVYGYAAIAYFDATNTSLKYVRDADGDMSFSDETPVTVINSFSEGYYASLAFDPLNRPMIAHKDVTNSAVRYSVYEPGIGWVTTTVATAGDAGDQPSLAINPTTGFPAISFGWDSNLAYAEWNGSEWDIAILDTQGVVGDFSSLAFDPADGNPAISYYDQTEYRLKFAWYDGVAWHTQQVANAGLGGLSTSLAFNDYGTGWPSIMYFDTGGGLYFIEDPPDVPEPACLLPLALGAAALRRRRRAA